MATGLALTATFVLAVPLSPAAARPSVPRHLKPAGIPVRVVLTTASLSRALTAMPTIRFGTAANRGVPVLHVNDRVGYQRMIGFGAAMTDSSAWLLYTQLPPPVRQLAMSSLFSPAGIHLDLTRVPIGGSDFTVGGHPYSYDDLPAGLTDPLLSHFSVAHDDAYILPSLRQMLAIDPGIEVLATPWSPPPWMKANVSFDDLAGRGAVLPGYYQPLADYFVRFIDAYRSEGVPIWGITPENEPNAYSAFPASALAAQNEAVFVARNLVPALAAARLYPRIYGNETGGNVSYAQTLLASPGASDLSGLAWHCYGGEQAMSTIHETHPGIQELMTECSPGIIPYKAAEAAISGARNWASTIVLWNLALDPAGGPVQPPNTGCGGCTGLLRISERTHTLGYTLSYYQLGQLSKFVQRGALRIGTERWVSDFGTASGYGVTEGLDNVAFLNPNGTRVLIAYNHSAHPFRFAASWHGSSFAYTLAAGATVTFTWK
jgi:glucosylceramidase